MTVPQRTSSHQDIRWPRDQTINGRVLAMIDRACFGWVRPFVHLGRPYVNGSAICRDILGGLLAAAPGGRVGTEMRNGPDGPQIRSYIERYAPRLPSRLYELIQAPFHRTLIASVVAVVAARHRARG